MKHIRERALRRVLAGWLCLSFLFFAGAYPLMAQSNSLPNLPGTATNLPNRVTPPTDLLPPMPPMPTPRVRPPGAAPTTLARPQLPPSNAFPPRIAPPPSLNLPQPIPPNVLAFDADRKEVQLQAGEQKAHFVFYVTNVSSSNVLITALRPSCGCTVAKLPQQPWPLAPGQSGPIEADMSVYATHGTTTKSLTAETSVGTKYLVLSAKAHETPPQPVNTLSLTPAERQRHLQIAKMDRQITLHSECVSCHVQPAIGKMGRELFVNACGICHLAQDRSPLVNDLQGRHRAMPPDYWKLFITQGKPGTPMPAFTRENAGFLTPEQSASLIDYLVKEFPKEGKLVYENLIQVKTAAASTNSGPEVFNATGFFVPSLGGSSEKDKK